MQPKIILLLLLLVAIKPAFAQSPSKQEMQNQMAQVIKKLNQQITDLEKQIAEAKKNKEPEESVTSMEDQLAMLKKQVTAMGGLTKGISNLSDKTIKEGAEQSEDENGLPKRDDARINALPKQTLTDAELAVFVQKVNLAIDKKLSISQKNYAKELYNEVNAKEKSPGETGNIAVLCWLGQSTDMAIWIMGRACMDDPSNTDNLSNYASFLLMVGGEQLAIPILQNLVSKFPGNTTLMNNLGQAWFGLGDMKKANEYASGTVRMMAAHPYANETICGIAEAENDPDQSIESLKRSLQEDYTPEKEANLERRGYHVKFEDIRFKYPTKATPLGIEKFLLNPPGYTFEGGEAAATNAMEWYDYREKIAALTSALNETRKDIDLKVENYRKKLLGDLPSQGITARQVNVSALAKRVNPVLQPYNNKVYKTAKRKYDLLLEWYTDRFLAMDKKMKSAADTIETWRREYNTALQACAKRHEHDNDGSAYCAEAKDLATTFNGKANAIWQQRNAELLTLEKEFLNQRANLSLYASLDPSIYEQDVLSMKLEILGFLSSLHHEVEIGCTPVKDIPKPQGKVLPDFDEMNCQYKTELSIKYGKLDFSNYFSIKIECNKMTTKFDAKYIKGSLEENLANGKYKGTVEVQVKVGKDMAPFGPIDYIEHVLNPVGPEGPFQAGTEVKAGAGIDFTEGGIQDVYVTGKVGVKAGLTGIDAPVPSSVSISSIEGRMSVITGQGSITGKGAFSGISIK